MPLVNSDQLGHCCCGRKEVSPEGRYDFCDDLNFQARQHRLMCEEYRKAVLTVLAHEDCGGTLRRTLTVALETDKVRARQIREHADEVEKRQRRKLEMICANEE